MRHLNLFSMTRVKGIFKDIVIIAPKHIYFWPFFFNCLTEMCFGAKIPYLPYIFGQTGLCKQSRSDAADVESNQGLHSSNNF